MALISKSDAESLLRPHHDDIYEAFRIAWSVWWNQLRSYFDLPTKRVRANIIYELIIQEVRRRLGATAGVWFDERPERFLVNIANRILVRFKKLDEEMHTANYPTQAALDFDRQLHLPGIPDLARVTIGYQLDPLGISMRGVHAMLTVGKHHDWIYPIPAPAAAPLVVVPTPSPALPMPAKPVLVGAKKADDDMKKKTDDRK